MHKADRDACGAEATLSIVVATLELRAFPASQRLLEGGRFGRAALLEGVLEDEGAGPHGRFAIDERLGRTFSVLNDQLAEPGEVGGPEHPGKAQLPGGGGEALAGLGGEALEVPGGQLV